MPTPANYAWVPSTARVIRLDGFGPVPRGSTQVLPAQLNWPVKDPGDVLDYVFDVSEALAGNDGDTITTLDIQIFPNGAGDLTLRSSSADGDQAILWLAGGYAGVIYAVTITLGTNSGRVITRTVSLPVLPLAAQMMSGSALTDQTGIAITDQTNQPITTS